VHLHDLAAMMVTRYRPSSMPMCPPSPVARFRRSRAFTILEVLVVVAIVGVLVALLLPTLSRARELANRARCMANLREVHRTLVVYATDNRGVVPVGYRAGRKQWNSMVFSATSKKFCLFGTLYEARLMPEPRVFFCPSDDDPRSQFASETNPWPPGDPSKQVFCGYGFRPDHQLVDELHKTAGAFAPMLRSFENKAILADLTATPDRIDLRHRQGVNVIYNDGAAAWVHRSRFETPLQACPAIDPSANPHQDAIWQLLDQR
jgi:prepilin-type N-terminal cleavage/methylation domain-containing protein